MQCACDFDAGGNLPGGLELAKTLVAGGDDFGKVLVQREGADVAQEGLLGGGVDPRAETLDKGRVFLQGRIERFANWEEILKSSIRSVINGWLCCLFE